MPLTPPIGVRRRWRIFDWISGDFIGCADRAWLCVPFELMSFLDWNAQHMKLNIVPLLLLLRSPVDETIMGDNLMLMTEMKTHLFYCRALFYYLSIRRSSLSPIHCHGHCRRRPKRDSSFRFLSPFRPVYYIVYLVFVIDFNCLTAAGWMPDAALSWSRVPAKPICCTMNLWSFHVAANILARTNLRSLMFFKMNI